MPNNNLTIRIPINHGKEKLDELNAGLGTNFKTTEEHVDDLHEQLDELLQTCGDENGWYVGDSITVEISVKYEPEDK